MTLREIYEAAVHMVCEEPDDDTSADYEDRAAYILPTFCGHCAVSDVKYRLAHGMAAVTPTSAAYMELTEAFPLSEVFVAPATYYLAAMLTVDENEELSERFFALYTDALAAVEASLPASGETVADRYGLL